MAMKDSLIGWQVFIKTAEQQMLNKALEHSLTTIINKCTRYIKLQVTIATIPVFDDSQKRTSTNQPLNQPPAHFGNSLFSPG